MHIRAAFNELKGSMPSLRNLGKPRPYLLDVVGRTLNRIGTIIAGMSVYNNDKTAAFITLGCMACGGFFTDLYAAKVNTKDESEEEECITPPSADADETEPQRI